MYVCVDPLNVPNQMDFWVTLRIRKLRRSDILPDKPWLRRDFSNLPDDSSIFPLE